MSFLHDIIILVIQIQKSGHQEFNTIDVINAINYPNKDVGYIGVGMTAYEICETVLLA